ncbi:MAG: LPS export ABC transporter periplasmic protein LptC [Candidatus Competibacterales bacterium]
MGSLRFLAPLLVLAAASSWLLLAVESRLQGEGAAAKLPTLTMDAVQAAQLTAAGEREYTLLATHWVQHPDPGGTDLLLPDVHVFETGRLAWLVRADRGWVAPRGETVQLHGGVAITRPTPSSGPPLLITAREMWLHPPTRRVTSKQRVRLKTPSGWIEGTGLEADFNADSIRLLNDVRGAYEPPPSRAPLAD